MRLHRWRRHSACGGLSPEQFETSEPRLGCVHYYVGRIIIAILDLITFNEQNPAIIVEGAACGIKLALKVTMVNNLTLSELLYYFCKRCLNCLNAS